MSDGKVSNFESLDAALQAAELEVLPEITPELARDRQSLVSAFQRMGVARVELGKAIAAYHQHFKAERAWLGVTPVLLKWIGRTSLTTLYNLIGDAERDQSLSGPRRAALNRIGINPATRRYGGIVELLAGGRDAEIPEDADHAVQVALEASKTRLAAPDLASPFAVPLRMTVDELAAEQIERAEDFAKVHMEVNRETIAMAVISRFQVWAGITAGQPADISATTPETGPEEEANLLAMDRSPVLKVVSMYGKRKRKSPAPAPTLFDFGAEQQELA